MDVPFLFLCIAAVLFGAVLGSFLNVLIYRLPRESLSILRPLRSYCPACGTPIPWYDNLPVISYVRLQGLCRRCGCPIPARYLLVEILTAGLVLALAFREGPGLLDRTGPLLVRWCVFGVHLYLTAVLVVTAFIDLEFRIIPDEITVTGMVLGPPVCLLLPALQARSGLFSLAAAQGLNPHLAALCSSLGGLLVGGGGLLLVGFLGRLLLRRDALGMGDVKFMAFAGAFLGWEGALLVFFLGCAAGSVVGLPLRLAFGRREIPFGPFLALGWVWVLHFQEAMVRFLTVKWPEIVRSFFT